MVDHRSFVFGCWHSSLSHRTSKVYCMNRHFLYIIRRVIVALILWAIFSFIRSVRADEPYQSLVFVGNSQSAWYEQSFGDYTFSGSFSTDDYPIYWKVDNHNWQILERGGSGGWIIHNITTPTSPAWELIWGGQTWPPTADPIRRPDCPTPISQTGFYVIDAHDGGSEASLGVGEPTTDPLPGHELMPDAVWVFYDGQFYYWSTTGDPWPGNKFDYKWHDIVDDQDPHYPGYYEYLPGDIQTWKWDHNTEQVIPVPPPDPSDLPVDYTPPPEPVDPVDPDDLSQVEDYLKQIRDAVGQGTVDNASYILGGIDKLRSDVVAGSATIVNGVDSMHNSMIGGHAAIVSAVDNLEGVSSDIKDTLESTGGQPDQYSGSTVSDEAENDQVISDSESEISDFSSVVSESQSKSLALENEGKDLLGRMFSLDFPAIGQDPVWAITFPLSVFGGDDVDLSFDCSDYPIVLTLRVLTLWALMVASVFFAIKIVRKGIA